MPYVQMGVGLFVFIVVIYSLFLWFKPERLMFDASAYLKRDELYGTKSQPKKADELEREPSTEPVKP